MSIMIINLIIGDSMIENIMNPIECNLGYYIKNQMKEKYGVFEIGDQE